LLEVKQSLQLLEQWLNTPLARKSAKVLAISPELTAKYARKAAVNLIFKVIFFRQDWNFFFLLFSFLV